MTPNPIKATATRKADGWHLTIEYENGGRIVGRQGFVTMDEAENEATSIISLMGKYPDLFINEHPAKNQLIDLSI
jgi:hypothetical protein